MKSVHAFTKSIFVEVVCLKYKTYERESILYYQIFNIHKRECEKSSEQESSPNYPNYVSISIFRKIIIEIFECSVINHEFLTILIRSILQFLNNFIFEFIIFQVFFFKK